MLLGVDLDMGMQDLIRSDVHHILRFPSAFRNLPLVQQEKGQRNADPLYAVQFRLNYFFGFHSRASR
jgi:hypothetical protein